MPPKVSVITINRNMADDLARTVASVTAQARADIEFLVIDGNSTDGSVGIIRQNADRIAYWISERDTNLYDAMNKGVRAATGNWIIFMNSGDVFADADVVCDVFAESHDDADLIYGHAVWHHPGANVNTMRMGEGPSILPLRMNCSHQAVFTRRELLLRHPLDDRLLVADYEFLLWAWRDGARFWAVDRVIAKASAGGISDRRRMRSSLERMTTVWRAGLMTLPLALRYSLILLREPLAGLIKSLLPPLFVRLVLRARGGRR